MVRSFFIGRFQPFHYGHRDLCERAMEETDEAIIGIGSSRQAYSETNPFTAEERKDMIENSIEGKYEVVQIPDINDYENWVKHVEGLTPDFEVVYSGSPITIDLFHDEGYEVREIDDEGISGTDIPKMLARKDERWKDYVPDGSVEAIEEAKGEERMHYLSKNSGKSTVTVDAVVEYDDGIVLIERDSSPFKGKLALPGGHVRKDENLEKAAEREVKEETNLELDIEGILGVYSDPDRDPRGYYTTTVFYGEGEGEVKSGGDASNVEVLEDSPDDLAFDHSEILKDYEKILGEENEGR